MAYSNKFTSYGNPAKIYLQSQYVSVYPSAYRGSDNGIPFDPEARLNTEKNIITHSALPANKSYIISWDNAVLKCIIGGYYFTLNIAEADMGNIGETRFANVKLVDAILASPKTTKILGSWVLSDGNVLDTPPSEGAAYIFGGLYFSATADNSVGAYSLAITDSTGHALSASGSIAYTEIQSAYNYLGSLGNATNVKYFAPITGNLVNGGGTDSIVGMYTGATKKLNIASGINAVALGYDTRAANYEFVIGKYNTTEVNAYFIVGNGTGDLARTNAFAVYSNGNAKVAGDLAVNGGDITTNKETLTIGNTITTAQTLNLGTAITSSGITKIVNLGTGAASGSITNINIGSAEGGTTTINSPNIVVKGTLINSTTTSVPLSVNSIDSTTANLQDWSSNNNLLLSVDIDGNISAGERGLTISGEGAYLTLSDSGDTYLDAGIAALYLRGSSIIVDDDLVVNSGNIKTSNGLFTIGNPNTAVGQTLNLGTTATISGKTKVINLGTGAATGSTTNIYIGSDKGGTTTINSLSTIISGNLAVNGTSISSTSENFDLINTDIAAYSPRTRTINISAGAVGGNITKNLNISTGAVGSSAISNINIGVSSNGTTNIRSQNVTLNGNLKINTDKFVVTATSGNLVSKGTITATAFYASSDERLKENIVDYKYHDSILDIPVKEFDYKETGVHAVGFIAQELQEKFPELVNTGEDGYLSIAENKLVYLLLEEVKLLKEEVKQLKRGG